MAQYLDQPGEFHAHLYTQYQAYGTQSGIVDFWLLLGAQENLCGVISRLDDRFTVAAEEDSCDLEELACFLCTAGNSVQGAFTLISRLNHTIHGKLCSSWIVRAAQTQNHPLPFTLYPAMSYAQDRSISIRPADALSQVFHIICAADAAFALRVQYDSWLSDTSYKVRHQLSQVYVLYQEKLPVCTMGICFQNSHTALLGGLATLPMKKKQGYGSCILQYTTSTAIKRGQVPGLLVADDCLLSFYQKNGFTPAGRWGLLVF